MDKQTKVKISVVIKFAIFVFAAAGLAACLVSSGGFMSGNTMLKYFTIQSNIWIALCAIILAFKQQKLLKSGIFELSKTCAVIQQVFTVSITLTGFVYCFVLLPSFIASGFGNLAQVLAWPQLFLHVLVPVLSVVDLLAFTRPTTYTYSKYDFLFAALPPIYYLGFARVGYVLNWDFGMGQNYPYFFLNYGSPAGMFGFSNQMPYFMGVFWWIIALTVFVLAISKLYTFIVNRKIKKANSKLI